MKNKTLYYISTPTFIAAEIAILMCILFAPHSEYSCYAAIVVVLVYSLLFASDKPKVMLMQLALVCTLAADTFLVGLTTQVQWLAMTAFFVCQSLYFARLLLELKTKKWLVDNIAIRLILIAAAITAAFVVLKDKFDYVSAISVVYYASLIHNLVIACCMIKKSPMFAIGLIFFLLCDTVVGLNSAIGTYISISETSFIYQISHTSFNLAWTFYVPSQTLIALSIVDATKDKNSENRTEKTK
ncbi:MAG: hypothetical protein IJ542_00580 [Clostridia bacterium]|nr:hypothetical protein [Clostridia bacterium]